MYQNLLYDKIQKAQLGDQNKMLLLIQQFDPLLKKYSYKLNYEDAKNDLVIFFIECIKSFPLDGFTKEISEYTILSYLKTSILHTYYSLSKKQHEFQSQISVYNEDVENTLSYCTDMYKHFEIIDWLDKLTLLQRKVIILRYYYGYSDFEIGKALNITRQSVNRIKNRGLNILRSFANE